MGDTQENWTFLSGTNPLKTSGLPPPPPQEPRAAAEAMGLVSRNLSLTLKTELLFKRAEGSSTLSHLILFQKEAGAFMQPESSLWACKGAWSFPRWVSPTSPPHVPGGSVVKNPPANAGDTGSIPGSGRSPGEGNGNPRQYSCLGNPMDRGGWWATVHAVARVGHDLVIKSPPAIFHCLVCHVFFTHSSVSGHLEGTFLFEN